MVVPSFWKQASPARAGKNSISKSMASKTVKAASITSGPMPSPGITHILYMLNSPTSLVAQTIFYRKYIIKLPAGLFFNHTFVIFG
jgi:hypothetical protein